MKTITWIWITSVCRTNTISSHHIASRWKVYKIHKGIVTHELLLQHYKELKAEFVSRLCRNRYESTIQSYTDESNRKATQNLIEKIKHLCPNCSTPDLILLQQCFALRKLLLPTRSTLSYLYQCKKSYRK
jgi:hypothetical protein